jgi:hypothetical protein
VSETGAIPIAPTRNTGSRAKRAIDILNERYARGEITRGKYVEAAIIAVLLVFNAMLGLFQESHGQKALSGADTIYT